MPYINFGSGSSADATKLPLAGGTMSGSILLAANNTLNVGSSANKLANLYVNRIEHSGILMMRTTGAGYSGVTAPAFFLDSGTVTLRNEIASVTHWNKDSSGHLVPGADNTYDVGSSANRVRVCNVVRTNHKVFTFGTLTNTPSTGDVQLISDCTTNTLNAVAAGGGSNLQFVKWTGSQWQVTG